MGTDATNEIEQLTEDLELVNEAETPDQQQEPPAPTEPAQVEEEPQAEETHEDEPLAEEPAVPEPPAKPKIQVPIAEKLRWKERARIAEQKLAQMEAMQEVPEEPALPQTGKSPLEEWAEANKDDPDAVAPARVLLADRKWQQEQANRQQAFVSTKTARTVLVQSIAQAKATMTDEVMGEGLGYMSLIGAVSAHGLFTDHDKAMIQAAGPQAGEAYYEIARKRALQPGSPIRGEVMAAIREHKAKIRPPSPAPNPNRQPSVPSQRRQAPTREQVLTAPKGPDYMADLGLSYE